MTYRNIKKERKKMRTNLFKKAFLSATLIPILGFSTISCSKIESTKSNTENIKLATFNVSFATDNDPTENYKRWVDFFSYTNEEQTEIINKWKNTQGKIIDGKLSKEEKKLSERIVQIRNVAAIIQHNRPDILLLNEFNNDGYGSKETMQLFQKNYLKHSQSLNSVDGNEMQEPIEYPYLESYSTNTGLKSGLDLNNNGKIDDSPDDMFGFGYYHGHYAFGLMSKYELDKENTRTFQKFLWKDMKEKDGITPVSIPTITANSQDKRIPVGMKTGDNWFTNEEWNKIRLSSKNHVDVPIIINNKKIHLLISHPTPPAFDTITETNILRNRYEILFWKHYVENKMFIYDDKGRFGGIDGLKEKFVIMGDLNADNFNSTNNPKTRIGINELISSQFINKDYAIGKWTPTSIGAKEDVMQNGQYRYNHEKPESRTSVFGLRVDWTLPSWNLNIFNTGVFWAGKKEKGKLLFNDSRIGKHGNSKEISSDHRMVWITIHLK